MVSRFFRDCIAVADFHASTTVAAFILADKGLERIGDELYGLLDELASKGEFLTEEEKMRQLTLDDLVPPEELIRGLREAKSIWVVPHHNPDPE